MRYSATSFICVCVVLCYCSLVILFSGCEKKPEPKQENSAEALNPNPTTHLEPVTRADQLALAYKYYLGEDVAANHSRAAMLFRKAADNGSSEAQFALGCMYQNGHGVAQNFMEATNWYLKAAQADNPNAQFLLGLSYKEGSGVPRDPLECYKWIYLAAEAGNTLHIATRQQLEQAYSPPMINEGRRRADQFRLYQGVNN